MRAEGEGQSGQLREKFIEVGGTCSKNAGSRKIAADNAFSLPMPIESNASIRLCLQEAGTSPALLSTASSSADAAASSESTVTGTAATPPLAVDDERCSGRGG
jgi:hypothetical protein